MSKDTNVTSPTLVNMVPVKVDDKTTIDNTKNDKGQIQQALCRILITLYAPRRHVISYEKDSYNSMRERERERERESTKLFGTTK